ncbi:MAG TPA: cyanophycinase [Candidatus Sulfotelmatobacter sp.]|nr:cyanophycinase [Candidatus Sulfotelmatobacter sp.]
MNQRSFFVAVLFCTAALPLHAADYKYIRMGSDRDVTTKAVPGYALMGGGTDLDEAFRFLCDKGEGGDFLIVRAAGDDDYNPYVNSLCKMNSVATLIIRSREAANDPKVSEIIQKAEVLFIAGGDQARYINWWQGTAVERALNADIAEGKPIGGTSAGLAVLGEFIYSSQGDAPDDPALTSAQALVDPYLSRVTVRRNFLKIDLLRNTLTDSHFAKRNRLGAHWLFSHGLCRMAGRRIRGRLPWMRKMRSWWKATAKRASSARAKERTSLRFRKRPRSAVPELR